MSIHDDTTCQDIVPGHGNTDMAQNKATKVKAASLSQNAFQAQAETSNQLISVSSQSTSVFDRSTSIWDRSTWTSNLSIHPAQSTGKMRREARPSVSSACPISGLSSTLHTSVLWLPRGISLDSPAAASSSESLLLEEQIQG